MAVLQVLHIPDERLRKVAEPVKEVNAEIQRIVDDMFDTMYAEEGIGLAATRSISISALSLLMCRKIVKSSWY
ncbi:peptide deformylase [Klebsiella pneumoniae]|nr:Peptide deformylase [Klebsiella pneumoniae]